MSFGSPIRAIADALGGARDLVRSYVAVRRDHNRLSKLLDSLLLETGIHLLPGEIKTDTRFELRHCLIADKPALCTYGLSYFMVIERKRKKVRLELVTLEQGEPDLLLQAWGKAIYQSMAFPGRRLAGADGKNDLVDVFEVARVPLPTMLAAEFVLLEVRRPTTRKSAQSGVQDTKAPSARKRDAKTPTPPRRRR